MTRSAAHRLDLLEAHVHQIDAAMVELRTRLQAIAARLDRQARRTENTALTALADAMKQAQMTQTTHEIGRDRCPACGCPEYASGNHTPCGDQSSRCDHCGCRGSLFLSP
jgi:hypothetical protein